MNKGFRYIIYSLFAMTMVACSGTKYVPEGAFLLDKVAVQADNNDTKSTDLSTYIRQKKRQSSELFLSFFAKRLIFQFIFYGIKVILHFFVYYFLFSID